MRSAYFMLHRQHIPQKTIQKLKDQYAIFLSHVKEHDQTTAKIACQLITEDALFRQYVSGHPFIFSVVIEQLDKDACRKTIKHISSNPYTQSLLTMLLTENGELKKYLLGEKANFGTTTSPKDYQSTDTEHLENFIFLMKSRSCQLIQEIWEHTHTRLITQLKTHSKTEIKKRLRIMFKPFFFDHHALMTAFIQHINDTDLLNTILTIIKNNSPDNPNHQSRHNLIKCIQQKLFNLQYTDGTNQQIMPDELIQFLSLLEERKTYEVRCLWSKEQTKLTIIRSIQEMPNDLKKKILKTMVFNTILHDNTLLVGFIKTMNDVTLLKHALTVANSLTISKKPTLTKIAKKEKTTLLQKYKTN